MQGFPVASSSDTFVPPDRITNFMSLMQRGFHLPPSAPPGQHNEEAEEEDDGNPYGDPMNCSDDDPFSQEGDPMPMFWLAMVDVICKSRSHLELLEQQNRH